jgi:hypothetical protein
MGTGVWELRVCPRRVRAWETLERYAYGAVMRREKSGKPQFVSSSGHQSHAIDIASSDDATEN